MDNSNRAQTSKGTKITNVGWPSTLDAPILPYISILSSVVRRKLKEAIDICVNLHSPRLTVEI